MYACGGYLVNLVEYEDGVVRAGLDDVFDDASGHGSDVCAAVSAYFALVVHTAERDAYVVALECAGYALAEAGLTYSWRTVETEYGGFHVGFELEDCEMLEDSLLDLLHAVVVMVENLLGSLEIKIVSCEFSPRKLQHGLQVVELHVVVGALGVDARQFGQFLFKSLGSLQTPVLAVGLLTQILYVVKFVGELVGIAQLSLEVANLLVEEILTLLAVEVFLSLLLYVLAHGCQLYLRIEKTYQKLGAFGIAVLTDELHLALGTEL